MITKEQQFIQELVQVQSETGGTSLITYQITPNTNIWLVQKHLQSELSSAINIKNKNIRKSICTSINIILQNISNIKNSGDNGLVILAGNIKESYI